MNWPCFIVIPSISPVCSKHKLSAMCGANHAADGLSPIVDSILQSARAALDSLKMSFDSMPMWFSQYAGWHCRT